MKEIKNKRIFLNFKHFVKRFNSGACSLKNAHYPILS